MTTTKTTKTTKTKRSRPLRVFGVVDPWGGAGMKPDEEVQHDADHLALMLDVKIELLGFAHDFRPVPPFIDVLFFDYGGATGGYGPNPFRDRCSEVRAWAEDHPSALVIVVSSFTWDSGRFVKGEWDDLMGREHTPPPPNILPLHDWRKRADGESEMDAIADWLGLPRPPKWGSDAKNSRGRKGVAVQGRANVRGGKAKGAQARRASQRR